MADLAALFARLGFVDAKTLLNSGNVVFKTDRRSDSALEKLLETETEKKFKVKAEFFIRTAQEMNAIAASNPFPKEAKNDPSRLHVVFLKDVVSARDVTSVHSANKGPESIKHGDRCVYIYYPDGAGESKLRLPWVGSGRNWNTVLKLIALLS